MDAIKPLDADDLTWAWSDDPQDREPPAAAPPAHEPTFPESWRLLNDVEIMSLPDPQWIIENVLRLSRNHRHLRAAWGRQDHTDGGHAGGDRDQ